MKNWIMFILYSFILLLACQQHGQQDYKNDDAISSESKTIESIYSQEKIILPDSVIITIVSPRFGMDSIVFSIYNSKESTIELLDSSFKKVLTETKSIQFLRRINDLFIEHKDSVVIAKEYSKEKVSSDLPFIKFEIYRDGKILTSEYFVGKRQNHYKITYSNSFLGLYNQLYAEANVLYELKCMYNNHSNSRMMNDGHNEMGSREH